jgi:hypothetical protein
MQEVSGSIPLGSTIFRLHQPNSFFAAVNGEKWWSQAAECAARQRSEAHEARRRPTQTTHAHHRRKMVEPSLPRSFAAQRGAQLF